MRNKLINLQKNLCLIETKGRNTIIMAECLTFLEQCIQECREEPIEVHQKVPEKK